MGNGKTRQCAKTNIMWNMIFARVIADASSVKITGADVSLMATNGDIKLISQNNILFHSNKGSVSIITVVAC